MADLDSKQVKDSAKLEEVEKALDKVKKELAELDAARLRRDFDKIQSTVLSLATKADIEKLSSEIARIRSLIVDLRDDQHALKDRVAKLEDLVETN